MRKTKTLLALAVLAAAITLFPAVLSSLLPLAALSAGGPDKVPVMEEVVFEKGGRTVTVMQMIHCASGEFYDGIRDRIDKVRENGGIHFYEWVSGDGASSPGWATALSKTVGLQAAMRRNCFRSGLVWQQPEGYVDFKKDVNADMTAGELDRALVARNGESLSGPVRFLVGRLCVSLPVDMIGAMIEDGFRKFISRAADGPDRQEYPIIIEARNRRALSMILESDFTSAYVTYGRNHFKGLAEGLSREGWTEVRRTEYPAW